MSVKHSDQFSLKKLREFCYNPPQGMISAWWFNGLAAYFTVEFIKYTQYSARWKVRRESAKEDYVNKLKTQIMHILESDISDDDVAFLNTIQDQLREYNLSKRRRQLN